MRSTFSACPWPKMKAGRPSWPFFLCHQLGAFSALDETSQGTTGSLPFLEGWGGTTGLWEPGLEAGGDSTGLTVLPFSSHSVCTRLIHFFCVYFLMPLVLCTYLILCISQKCHRMLEPEGNLEITHFNLAWRRKPTLRGAGGSAQRSRGICPEPQGTGPCPSVLDWGGCSLLSPSQSCFLTCPLPLHRTGRED